MSNQDQNNEPVTPQELAMLQAKASVTVIDVRLRAEFDAGHVEGELNIPLDGLSIDAIELAGGKDVVTVCASDGTRSHDAAERLRGLGRKARPLCDGTAAWTESQTTTKQGGER